MSSRPASARRFVFVSCNSSVWGGSEELWSAAAAALAEAGHGVSVLKPNLDEAQPRLRRLRELSCEMIDLARLPFLPRRVSKMVSPPTRPLMTRHRTFVLHAHLAWANPDLVIVSQGVNFDGTTLADVCRRMKKPYVLIAQKAADAYWPPDRTAMLTRAVYAEAQSCYFVSEHNRRLTEEQIGMALPHAHVVRNPFLVPWDRRDDWPSDRDGLRLACIARLYPGEKGQDLIIRVLAREKWRNRPLTVTFFGTGPNSEGLERLAAFHRVSSVAFGGFTDDVAAIWNDHHALLLPSRAEGLPLALVEAMLSGRVPIVTDVAGNAEIVRNNETGFIAAAPSEDAVDEALERAWQRRAEWRAIGQRGADEIRGLVPPDPARTFAGALLRIASQPAETVLDAAAISDP